MSDKIISLCYVSKRNEKSTELCRIADLEDDAFVPYTYNTGTDFYETERDLIYGSTVMLQAELESIGVYEWSVYLTATKEWRTETNKANEVSWCEVIFTMLDTSEQLVKILKRGYPMAKYDRFHDFLLCCRPSGYKCEAIFISKDDAVYKDGKLCLNESVFTLPRYTLDTRFGTGECKCRYSPYDTRKYLARKDACRENGRVEIKSKDEVIGEIVKQFVGKDILSRKERQTAKAALETLAMPSIIELVADRFQCSNDRAEKYIKEYISRIQVKIESTKSLQWIEMLIDNDSDSVQRMQAAVQKQWEETQQNQINAAQRRIEDAEATFNEINKKIADAENVLQKTQIRQIEVEKKIKEARLLQDEIELEIQKRLEKIKTNYASALVENAVFASSFLPGYQSSVVAKETVNRAEWAITLPENNPNEGTLEENIDIAVENWEEVCASQDMAYGLTLLSFAAYAKKQPLLIIGDGAILVSDLISSSICGQPAIKVHITDEVPNYPSIVNEIEKNKEAVICVINGLKGGYEHVRELMQMCPHRMFIITEMHAESLEMEPSSLFTVFVPVFCEYFYTGKQVGEFPTYNCSNELHAKVDQMSARSVKDARATASRWLTGGFYPPALKEKCAELFAIMNLLAQMLGVNPNSVRALAIEFLFAPILKCMRKEEPLKTHLEECTVLDGDRKANLISFVSMED